MQEAQDLLTTVMLYFQPTFVSFSVLHCEACTMGVFYLPLTNRGENAWHCPADMYGNLQARNHSGKRVSGGKSHRKHAQGTS